MMNCRVKKFEVTQNGIFWHSLYGQGYTKTRLSLMISGLAVTFLLASGCSQQDNSYEQSTTDMETAEYTTDQAADNSVNGFMSEISDSDVVTESDEQSSQLTIENLSNDSEQTLGSQAADIQIAGKKLLITASANFKVEDVVKSSNTIESLTRQQGGYVALSHISNRVQDSRTFVQGDKNVTITTYYRQAEMSVRVPRINVNKFLDQVQQQVAFLNEHQFSAQDVTLDIYREQLARQLNSDMASELSQERLNSKNDKDQASNIDAITATYAARRQQELAQLEQMDIADRVKYSTISLTFMQPDISYKETTQNLDVLIDAERPSFRTQVNQALRDGWEILRSVAIGLIQLWWLVILGGVFYLIYRMFKAVYRRFFKHDLRMNKLKRELMGENQNSKHSVDTKNNREEDKIDNNTDNSDSNDDNHSN